MRLFIPILANLLVFVASFGLGGLVRPLLPKNLSRLDRFTAIALAGTGLFGGLLFLVGLVAFSRTVIVAVSLLAAILGLRLLIKEQGTGPLPRFGEVPILPASIIGLVLMVTFVGGLAEPVGDIKMDAIAYHLLGPRVWLRDAVIRPLPDECHASFPATVETVYGALMAIGETRAPDLFSFSSFCFLLLVSYGFALRLGLAPPDAWWTVALIATMPVVYRGSYGGFIDAVFACFVLLSLRFALDARESRHYVLAGVFGGLAMGTKYTGVPTVILIIAVAGAFALVTFAAPPAKLAIRLAVMAVTAALIASPWYLRNWIALGSPIYPPPPLLLHFFKIKYMSPQTIDLLAALIRKEGLGMGHSFSNFVLLPFHFTFHPANFLNGPGGVGIALLSLAPVGLLLRWRDPYVGALMLFGFLHTLTWFVTEQEARFLIHIYVLLAIFAVWGWQEVMAKSPRIGRSLAGAAVACSIVYGLIFVVSPRIADVHAALSPSFEEQRKVQEIPFLEGFRALNEDPAVKKVLVLEPRVPVFYLQKDYLRPVGRFHEQSIPEGNDFALLAPKLSHYGITHILDVRLEGRDFRVPPNQPNLQLIFEREDQRIYRVTSTD